MASAASRTEIHKSSKKELKNTEEPALAVNVPDRQENLRYKRDPQECYQPSGNCTRREVGEPNCSQHYQHYPSVEKRVDMQGIDQMIDIKKTAPDVEHFQHKSEERNATQHHVGQIAEQGADKEPHLCPVFPHLLFRPAFNPALKRSCRFVFVENYKRSLVYFPIFLLLLV